MTNRQIKSSPDTPRWGAPTWSILEAIGAVGVYVWMWTGIGGNDIYRTLGLVGWGFITFHTVERAYREVRAVRVLRASVATEDLVPEFEPLGGPRGDLWDEPAVDLTAYRDRFRPGPY